ncbi:metallophosphoesterase [Nocardia sp. NEAU-G5]|uniref:Metallophosphoesterase n=1 Tax=Nocardia albiluteola TaxID=2842303 RepID=A0ABS6AUQ8_9NOCA|nr:metallophosphoesterase [Nocardia albiluteola]MBU3061760.1 metallophosphoesterase [Nocardia albiluteola]
MLAALAAIPIVAAAGPARAQENSMIATDLEVVTVTPTSVILTWTTLAPGPGGNPVPAGTQVRLAPADARGPARIRHDDSDRTSYHYAEITGLEPGRAYRFEAWSDGVRATPGSTVVTHLPGSPECTGQFTTLALPPGRLLRTLALSNDLHIGEETAGLIHAAELPGVRQEPGLPPYPEVMLTALLGDLRLPDRGADHLLVAGDLTAEATPAQTGSVRAHLDSWGVRERDWFAVRGNHDRPHVGPEYAGCPAVADAVHHDCWGESFGPRGQLTEHRLGDLRVLGLDTTLLDAPGGAIDPAQFDHLRTLLRADPDRPTLIFGHHPVTQDAAVSNINGLDFVLNRTDSLALQSLYRSAPGVFLHHAGHTHRNRRSGADIPLNVEFLEVGAVKEYPGGYTLVRIYEGGYIVNFYKTRTPDARRWSHRSRAEYLGLWPDYTLGSTADRNHTVLRDLSGLT